ncbi:casein kinase II regulatory subunit family protein [Entamoeba histolytica HM-3:IMSS]|uniref:Casein kinase II subunit beta n=5 Tax=Entamoeba histolytica TaxID=5759 RepID=C4M1F2_ENTH1|nr:casein kinase II regulatory subunit family protein [Entamoeba histolytica HM-1:IMSS]EMD43410.1 casein kinase II regulatory subunit family protein [Entamoeba histolytica KU27]EMS15990.1 casein kinase II regulatory subunit family protein [Entamoeba histolytica HM-3:IMSS]ENY59803.1 casein kinase II regulatory subunit family protein, putative [Entamoeba histolytica HM-1:IMSS-A]GAT95032.1 casein kinase II regulatory subunit family protein [Entamoeba histolytica]EAL43183.1 casein kinase II regula|eukprot:XP_648565.1 casein kinase II regulatory subunit family protein [Entamoeba histolytica HM-1:IMSS]
MEERGRQTNQSFSDDSSEDLDNPFDETWIELYCSLDGNEFLCEVDQSFIEDEFNLYGLRAFIEHYEEALDIISSKTTIQSYDKNLRRQLSIETKLLYGLIHQRFIVTVPGLKKMYEKFRRGEFGACPRVLCDNHAVLPIGTSNIPYLSKTKLFCPRCGEVYSIPDGYCGSNLDGAYFGMTFPHLLMLNVSGMKKADKFKPTIFGFEIASSSAPPGRFIPTRDSFFVVNN